MYALSDEHTKIRVRVRVRAIAIYSSHTRRIVLITGFDVSMLILPRCPGDSNSPQKGGPTTKVHSHEDAQRQYAPSKVQVVQ